MKIGFTGTRIGMSKAQKRVFESLIDEYWPEVFHHGLCQGADEEAHLIVRSMKPSCRIEGHPPTNYKFVSDVDCDKYFPQVPYLTRNKSIVNCASLLIATPKTNQEELRSGTWSTIRFARRTGKQLNIILPDGEISSL